MAASPLLRGRACLDQQSPLLIIVQDLSKINRLYMVGAVQNLRQTSEVFKTSEVSMT